LNEIPRQGGRFLWRQAHNAQSIGARIIYGAMFDEYDEVSCDFPQRRYFALGQFLEWS
jgi:hypothetical protein